MPHLWWQDHTLGRWLTLPDTGAEFLVACLVLLLTIAASWFWTVFQLPLILVYRQRPNLINELGTIFRESKDPVLSGLRLCHECIRNREFRRWNIYTLISLLVLYGVGMLVVSVVGPWALTQKSDRNPLVLASNPAGVRFWIRDPDFSSISDYVADASTEYMLNSTLAGEAYFRNCYEKSGVRCKSLSKDRLERIEARRVACPFHDEWLCYSKNFAPYELTTGAIPLRDLGLNIRQNVTLERKSTFVPLRHYDWEYLVEGKRLVDGSYIMIFGNNHSEGQAHFIMSDLKGQGVSDYVLRVKNFLHTGADLLSSRLDLLAPADRTIVVINAMGVTYEGVSDDPVFSVTTEQPMKLDDMIRKYKGLPVTTKYQPSTIGILSCVDRYQVCLNSPNDCTGFRPLSTFAQDLHLNIARDHEDDGIYSLEVQAALTAIYQPLWLTSIGHVLHSLGISAMAIRRTGMVNHEYQRRVVQDQWMKEAQRWFGLGLAGMQVALVDSVLGLDSEGDKTGLMDVLELTPKIKQKLGKMIMYKDGAYTNINGIGFIMICVVIFMGGLLRAVYGPMLRLGVRKNWLDRAHVDALGQKVTDGWEIKVGCFLTTAWEKIQFRRRWGVVSAAIVGLCQSIAGQIAELSRAIIELIHQTRGHRVVDAELTIPLEENDIEYIL